MNEKLSRLDWGIEALVAYVRRLKDAKKGRRASPLLT